MFISIVRFKYNQINASVINLKTATETLIYFFFKKKNIAIFTKIDKNKKHS